MTSASAQLIQQAITAANSLFPLAQVSVVYRASIAYILQHIKSFIAAIKPMKNQQLTPLEVQALQRFNGIVSHFATVLPHLGQKWLNAVLNWPSTHMHNYIDGFRKTLLDICKQLSLDSDSIMKFDQVQDSVNKIADLQHLKKALRGVRESAISCTNSVDIQQLIEVRLHSIQAHLPRKKSSAGEGKLSTSPSSDAIPVIELKQRMDKELSVFTSIDIPCDDLRIDETLGCGGFGTVFRATRLSTSELLAVKEVRSDKLTMSTWASLYSEVATMAPLKHKYVLELVGAHIKEPYRIITRYCPGKSLFDRLHRSPDHQLSAIQLTAIAYQVAEGMRFLHSNGIVHRDLKTMNILLDDAETAKIADFGLAGIMKDNKELIGGVGTPHYTAPEVLERKRYGPKVDTYSYGMILWEMATRSIPYRDKTHQEIIDTVVTRGWRLGIPKNINDNLKKLITRCWSSNVNERPDFAEIVKIFDSGQISFPGCDLHKFDKSILDPEETCPPLDVNYLVEILKQPTHDNFPTVIDFLSIHLDKQMIKVLHDKNILSFYTADSANTDSILLLAAYLLKENEFPTFLDEIGIPIINEIITYPTTSSIVSVVKFCLKVPENCLRKIEEIIPMFIGKMENPEIGQHIVCLLARLDAKSIEPYKQQIVGFLNPEGIASVEDQCTLDAVSRLLPLIVDLLSLDQLKLFIGLIEKDLDIPQSLIEILIQSVGQTYVVELVLALVAASSRTDITEPLCHILQTIKLPDLKIISQHYEVFDQTQRLLDENRLIDAALLLIFCLSEVPSVPPILANHPLLQSIINIEGHVAQRLQIFTSLFMSEQFCSDTTISEGVLKLLVSSLSTESLTDYSLKLIGALSSHASGCALISETGMLSIFSQMFLSSSCNDTQTSLTILTNSALSRTEIPQISLIISCLIQDLIYSAANKSEILQTLIHLIDVSPQSIQEHDLQTTILPLISTSQQPVIVVLALKLFEACDLVKVRSIYHQLAQRIYKILICPSMMYPEVIAAAIKLLSLICELYDLSSFIEKTQLYEFVDYVVDQYKDEEDLSDITEQIKEERNNIQDVIENGIKDPEMLMEYA